MHPVILKLGPITLHSYGLMMAIAFLVVLHFIQKAAKKAGYEPKVFADLAFIVLPLGIIGARLTYIIMFRDSFSISDPLGWIAVWKGGLVFQGGPPVAIAFGYWYLKKHQIPFWKACDIIFPYLALGHGIGRIGCLLYGCCFGAPTDAAWGMRFPRIINGDSITGSPAFQDHVDWYTEVTVESTHSLAVHPTQIISMIGLFMLFGIFIWMRKSWKPFDGFMFPIYLMLYGFFRFWIEGLRGDHNPVMVLNLTDQQIFSLSGAIFGLYFFLWLKKHQNRTSDTAPN